MYRLLFSLALIALVVGCGGKEEPKFSISEEGVKPVSSTAPPDSTEGVKFGVGDVESALRIEVMLPEDMLAVHNIEQEVTENKREIISKAEADIHFPFPQVVPLRVTCRSTKDYPAGTSARITVNLYRDNDIVETYTVLFGQTAHFQGTFKDFDILTHIDLSNADSFLFHARGEIEFFPTTPDDQLTLEMEPTPDMTRATRMGNPIRLNFKP